MTPNRRKIHRAFVIAPIVLLVLAGCTPTKPPTTDLDDAAHALATARDSGASTYAPLELRTAEEHLNQAQARTDKNDYDAARYLALESQADSELAMVKARLGKARAKVDARTRENAQLQQELHGTGVSPTGAQP